MKTWNNSKKILNPFLQCYSKYLNQYKNYELKTFYDNQKHKDILWKE